MTFSFSKFETVDFVIVEIELLVGASEADSCFVVT